MCLAVKYQEFSLVIFECQKISFSKKIKQKNKHKSNHSFHAFFPSARNLHQFFTPTRSFKLRLSHKIEEKISCLPSKTKTWAPRVVCLPRTGFSGTKAVAGPRWQEPGNPTAKSNHSKLAETRSGSDLWVGVPHAPSLFNLVFSGFGYAFWQPWVLKPGPHARQARVHSWSSITPTCF